MRVDANGNPLCVLTVHAHPDDEASKGAPTLAAYADLGVRTVLVCCTGGEEGDLQNPALREPGGPFHGVEPADEKAVMARLRPIELSRSAEIIGFHEVVMLGYRDSGMVDSPANQNPACFHQADLDEAVGRLVAVIRRTRPQVIITYNDDQRGYPHPDHVKVHDVSVVAFERAGDPTWYPWAGPVWQPLKMYYTVWTKTRMRMVHDAMIAKSGKSPFDEKWLSRPSHDDRVTTRLHIASHMHARSQALLAHATQVDPTEAWWFGLDDDELSALYPWEDWVLARSAVSPPEADAVEICLFDGIAEVLALPSGVDRPQRLVELERTTAS
jgi:mycothiol S-conjugate amidase